MKKTDAKLVVLVAAGVFVAGLVMNQFSNVAVVGMAKDGYR